MKNSVKKIGRLLLALMAFSLLSLPFVPARAAGASLYFSPSTGTFALGSKFSIIVKANTGGENINAAEGNIIFDADKLQVVNIVRNNSIFTLWPVGPNFSNKQGTITFGGGVPQPGFTGSQGNVCEVIFQAKKVGSAQIIFSSGSVLANDGKGTNILSSIGSASLTISPEVKAPEGAEEPVIEEVKEDRLETSVPEIIALSDFLDQNAWHNNNNLIVKWDLPEGASEASFAFDQSAATEPAKKGIKTTFQQFKDVEDGVWYFHLSYKSGTEWSPAKHYKIQIDTTPPAPLKLEVDSGKPGDWPVLDFSSIDHLSGLSKYEIHIDSFNETEVVVSPDQGSLKVTDMSVGKHSAIVKAIDNAGNEIYAKADFIIKPIETPVVKNYSKELKSSGQFFMSGMAPENSTINVYIQKSDEERVISRKVQADQTGSWYFVDEGGRANGMYMAWVEAVNANGLKSSQSERVSFIISPPIFARIGSFVVNYFTIFVSLLFMIILIIASIIYLGGLIRKKLKKETFEVEAVLHKHLEGLKREVERDMAELSKYKGTADFSRQKSKAKSKITKRIKVTEEKIMKEVKDVEDILH